jgi:cytochrome c oxidase assembly factor CtaG
VTPGWPALLSEWNFAPSLWIGVAALAVLYLIATRKPGHRATRAERSFFFAGLAGLLLALASPLDAWADTYLQSAHMLQHILLTLVASPLLVLGLPAWITSPLRSHPSLMRAGRFLTSPLVAYAVFNLTFLVWHVPALYEAALGNEAIHVAEHLSFLATACLTWWPVFSSSAELPPLAPGVQILYLFLQGIPSTVLTAIIVFSPGLLYPTYADAPRVFGITPEMDQQIAGLLMGALGMLIFLTILTFVFFRWEHQDSLMDGGGSFTTKAQKAQRKT